MLAASLTDPQRAWLLALLILWVALLFGGFAFGRLNAERTRRMPAWTRIASSLALVVAAWSWCAFAAGGPADFYTLLIALGMSLGCLGDVFLADILPLRQPVLWGIASFGLGHIAYIAALVGLGSALGLDAAAPRWGALAAWLLAGLAGWYLVVWRGAAKRSVLHAAALPYALLLAATAGLATGLALQAPALAPLALGGALFLASDLILAAQLFSGLAFPLIGDVIWLTYGPAQALIVYAAATVLPLATRPA
jgi:YhhN-like protein